MSVFLIMKMVISVAREEFTKCVRLVGAGREGAEQLFENI